MTDRESCLHCARVYLAEARRRRNSAGDFHATLLRWAANARRKAAAEPTQKEMAI